MTAALRVFLRGAAGLGVFVAILLAAPAHAQTAATVWEHIKLPVGTNATYAANLAFRHGAALDGSDDTLYSQFGYTGLRRLAIGRIGDGWSTDLHRITGEPDHLLVTRSGTLLGASRGGPVRIDRSTDDGRTWSRDVAGRHANCLYERPSGRGVLACAFDDAVDASTPGRGYVLMRSADDGATWAFGGQFPGGADGDPLGSEANALFELARAGPGGAPRLVAGVKNGIALSDDDGTTWRRSALWSPYRWYVTGFAQAVAGSPQALGTASAAQALGDTLFAAASDFSTGRPVVLASVDGQTWAVRHTFNDYASNVLVVGPDGALWVGIVRIATASLPTVVWRSVDGGRRWSPAQDGYDGQGAQTFATGRDGRLYLGGGSGVWRTRTPVVVAAEAAPAEVRSVGVSVRPNPTGGRVEVVLSLAEAQDVRVAVLDVLGREVVVVLTGPLPGGERVSSIDTSAWPAGVYVVRVVAGSRVASARLVVAR